MIYTSFSETNIVSIDENNKFLYCSRRAPGKEDVNQDALLIWQQDQNVVLAVADGAGGYPKGADAAQLILENLIANTKDLKGQDLQSAILSAIDISNENLIAQGLGSRTTISICSIQDGLARTYQVGDSATLICGSKGKMIYRSTSHSPVGYKIEAGEINEEEALEDPDIHYISNLVGEAEMKIEIGPKIILKERDTIFIASDGIFDNIASDEIISCIRSGGLEEIADNMAIIMNDLIYNNSQAKIDDIAYIVYKY